MKSFTITTAQAIDWMEALQRAMSNRIPLKYSTIIRRNAMALAGTPDIAAALPARLELLKAYWQEVSPGMFRPLDEKFQQFSLEWEPIAARQITVELLPLPEAMRECDGLLMSGADDLVLTGLWE